MYLFICFNVNNLRLKLVNFIKIFIYIVKSFLMCTCFQFVRLMPLKFWMTFVFECVGDSKIFRLIIIILNIEQKNSWLIDWLILICLVKGIFTVRNHAAVCAAQLYLKKRYWPLIQRKKKGKLFPSTSSHSVIFLCLFKSTK